MSSFSQTIVDVLNADAQLLSILTGGVYLFSAAGKDGLNRIQLPGAFNPQTGLTRPVCVVAEFPENADNQIVDTMSGYHSTVTAVVTRLYDNGNVGYATIELGFQRIYALLAYAQIPGSFQVLFQRVLRDRRDPLLKDAAYLDAYWNVHGSLSFT